MKAEGKGKEEMINQHEGVVEAEQATFADLDESMVNHEDELVKSLKDSAPHRKKLHDELQELLADLRHEALDALETATAGNPELFKTLRKRVLDSAGQNIRQIDQVLRCFIVCQVQERQVVMKTTVTNDHPWRLPQGVKMPSEKQQ